MIPSTLQNDSSRDIVTGFLNDMIRRLGWHAAQAWWAEGDELVPGMWALADGAPDDLRDLVSSHEKLLIEDAGLRFLEPTSVAAAALPCVRACVPQLESMGLAELVVLDIPGVFDLDVRLVFVPSVAQPLTPRVAEMLASSARLMPTVIRGERERHQLSESAGRDPLTGLLNRRGLDAAVAALPAVGGLRAVLYIDLDKFKAVNDTHGHTVGDDVLMTVTRHVSSQIRPDDALARLGGDEFVLIASAVASPESARQVADRILSAITTDLRSAAAPLVAISASVGVALWDGITPFADALAAADRLMYEAKRAGGGIASVDSDGHLVVSNPLDSHHSDRVTVSREVIRELATGQVWGQILRLVGESASETSHEIAERVASLVGPEESGTVILELAGEFWAREGVLSAVVVAVRERAAAASVALMIAAGSETPALRTVVSDLSARLGTGTVVVSLDQDSAALGAVAAERPRALALSPEVVRSMDESPADPADSSHDILVRIVVAVADVIGVPVIARHITSATIAARLVAAGCSLGTDPSVTDGTLKENA